MVGDEKALQHSRAVADFDAETTTCPACFTEFKTAGTQYCPDCGLKLRDD